MNKENLKCSITEDQGGNTLPWYGKLEATTQQHVPIPNWNPERSEWHCEAFGTGSCIVINPLKGKEPNWFWRWMQCLCFGNKWVKK
jgi:hypothetical protein